MSKPNKLRIIPLGGCGEIGKNMTAIEFGDEVILIDCGVSFPEEEMLGVDLVIPDITYLTDHARTIRALLVTHGHEDHVGAIPYLLPKLNAPIYATRLTMGLIEIKLKEHRILEGAHLNVIQPGDVVDLGPFTAEFFRVCHSIPDGVGIAIRTPLGTIVHSGDYKFDHTPIDGKTTDFARLALLGQQGVLLLLADSTRTETPGYTPSERVITETFDKVFAQAPGRIIVSTFASIISRIQQVLDIAALYERKVAFVGRSMVNNVNMALELGYLNAPPNVIVKPEELDKLRDDQVALMTTGAQGEPTSALARMANNDHRQITIKHGDTVIVSASPIPGNEKLIGRTIDNLYRLGATVLYHGIADVHVSGHAAQEEQKLLIRLLNPTFFLPIHGEYRHLVQHARLAEHMGIPASNVLIVEDGQIVELGHDFIRKNGTVPSGYVFVDGLGVGDVGEVVLRDRRVLSRDGVAIVVVTVDKQSGKIVAGPDIITRGFVYVRDSEELIDSARQHILEAMEAGGAEMSVVAFAQTKLHGILGRYFHEQTHRRPMILPVVTEV